MKRVAFGVGLVAITASIGACTTNDTSTQLTVALTSEASIPNEVNLLEVTVTSGGSTPLVESYDLSRDDNGYFPQTLALVPRDKASLTNPVTVTVKALDDKSNTTVVARSVTASYVEGHTLLIPVALRMACFNSGCDTAGYSCVGGQCVSDAVPTTSLVDYEASYVFAAPDAGSESCFDMQTCIGGATFTNVGTQKLNASGNVEDCTFPIPSAAITTGGPNLNVAIEWAAAKNRIIVLNGNDPNEGWTVSPTDPTTGVLSQGVCNAVKGSPESPGYAQMLKSTAANPGVLYLSTACAAKPILKPSCDPSTNIGITCSGGTCDH